MINSSVIKQLQTIHSTAWEDKEVIIETYHGKYIIDNIVASGKGPITIYCEPIEVEIKTN